MGFKWWATIGKQSKLVERKKGHRNVVVCGRTARPGALEVDSNCCSKV